MKDRKINILCLQETKWVGIIDGYKLGYTSKVSHMNGVGIIVDEVWKKNTWLKFIEVVTDYYR